MQLKQLAASLALAGTVSAQALTDVISQTPQLSTLGALLTQYPAVAQTLANASNITVLAPTNEAFSAFLTSAVNESIAADAGLVPAVLSYHVLSGTIKSTDIPTTPAFPKTLLTNATFTNVTGGQVVKAQAVNGGVTFTSGLLKTSNVSTADVTFSGGVVHIIDSVLTIPVSASDTATAANLTALAGALTQADLVTAVDDAKDITVFAPENSAFASIANLVSTLSTQQLTSILEYHVVNGTVGYSSTLSNGESIPTLQGGSVKVTITNGNIFINSAEVVVPDVLIANGVAHVIDNVLNPGNSTATPTGTAGSPGFSGASSASNVPFTSGVAATATGATATGATGTAATAGVPRQTAAIGAAALFGGAAFLANM
ncbi:hypothetical protein N0V82_002035 [Gnomoniopsis sp. IMI 355080]|nr:hypothetical protein N0V82_002035 [Gnomoniopsis sp. IMI 355080]